MFLIFVFVVIFFRPFLGVIGCSSVDSSIVGTTLPDDDFLKVREFGVG
jgi:hypothetical protein